MRCHWLSVLSVFSAIHLADPAAPPAPLWGDIRVMHTWDSVPAKWESLGPPPAGTTIDLYIALKPHHENALTDTLYEVSDPGHQKYGAHLTKEQVANLVAPHQDTLKIVHSWLEHHGVPPSSISTSHGGGWLTIIGLPVSQADELLCASYQLYRHTGTDGTKAVLRTVGYALPAALHEHVQTVAPTTHFASPRTPRQTPRKGRSKGAAVKVNATSGKLVRALSRRDDQITPPFLRWLYKSQEYVPTAMDKNVIGTLGFENDYPSQTDLTQFMSNFRADAEAATFIVVQVNGGGYDEINPGVVGSINTQYAEVMAYPTPHIFYSTGGGPKWRETDKKPAPGDAFLEWFNHLFAQRSIPRTLSISYYSPESEYPRAYAIALCELFAQLGARGVSVLVASGNDGVGDLEDCDRGKTRKFMPTFPASCPWVTSVGGTTGHDPEVAAALSGGGFSRYFTRPVYQNLAVLPYLEFLGTETHAAYFRRGGRGIPDIAAQALRFVYVRDGILIEVNGTVCSTSTLAGIVSLFNDYRLSTGRDSLGFLNYWLYRNRLGGLNDITSGSNPGCDTDGFSATAGWDPVTGLGTLNFRIL